MSQYLITATIWGAASLLLVPIAGCGQASNTSHVPSSAESSSEYPLNADKNVGSLRTEAATPTPPDDKAHFVASGKLFDAMMAELGPSILICSSVAVLSVAATKEKFSQDGSPVRTAACRSTVPWSFETVCQHDRNPSHFKPEPSLEPLYL